MTIELKPCPFCGHKAYLYVNNGARVICSKCGASSKILVDSMSADRVNGCAVKSVIDAWNRRANDEH